MILREALPWNAYDIERAILRWNFLSQSDGNSMSFYETEMQYIEEKQTHDVASRFGNRTTLFILATWTLIDCVAPYQEKLAVMNDNDDDYDVGSPAYSHKMLLMMTMMMILSCDIIMMI